MKTYLEVYRPGTKVNIIDNNMRIPGFITRTNLIGMPITIMYEVSYFLNNSHCCGGFYDFQLEFDPNEEKKKIGFREIKEELRNE